MLHTPGAFLHPPLHTVLPTDINNMPTDDNYDHNNHDCDNDNGNNNDERRKKGQKNPLIQ
jgi:hypothetical protein